MTPFSSSIFRSSSVNVTLYLGAIIPPVKTSKVLYHNYIIIRMFILYTVLAMLATFGLPVIIGENGIITKESDQQIFPAHIETCQALLLQLPQSKLGLNEVIPTVFQ